MTDGKLHDEAEEIRKETAEGSPEVAEHDHVAELERQLEEAKSNALYAAAETQNVRRRLEAELKQAFNRLKTSDYPVRDPDYSVMSAQRSEYQAYINGLANHLGNPTSTLVRQA